jgi:hypothetical protein
MNLLDIFEGREPYQQAIDKLEQRRIEDLEAKMDDYARRGMKDEFQKCKAERDSYYKVNEAGIGQDIVNKSEKMARATPTTKVGAVASTVKNAAKWLAGKGGPGKEGPTYESDNSDEDNYEQVLDAIAALYGPEIWDNDAMGDLANDLEQANPTPEELAFIIKHSKLPKRLQGMQFTNNDTVQFGEAKWNPETGGDFSDTHDMNHLPGNDAEETDPKEQAKLLKSMIQYYGNNALVTRALDDLYRVTVGGGYYDSVVRPDKYLATLENQRTGKTEKQYFKNKQEAYRYAKGMSSIVTNLEKIDTQEDTSDLITLPVILGLGDHKKKWMLKFPSEDYAQKWEFKHKNAAQIQWPSGHGLAEGSQDSKSWMAEIKAKYPDAKFMQAKMPGAPIRAYVDNKVVAEFSFDQSEQRKNTTLDEKKLGANRPKLGTARDVGKSVKKFRAQRGLEEAGTDGQWSKEGEWKKVPKAKSGRPADPRGEVTHLSDVARREAERKAQAQKKNPKAVAEDREEIHNPWDVTDVDPVTETDFEVTLKGPDNQQLNYIVRPVDFIEDRPNRLTIDSMDVRDLQTGQTMHWHTGNAWRDNTGKIQQWVFIFGAIDYYFSKNPALQKQLRNIVDHYLEGGKQGKNPNLMPGLKDRPQSNNIIPADRFIKAHQDMKRVTGQDVDEGYQDFNKVEPYAVCLAGKPVKKFDYYEDARRFHDNWKKKLYREGNTEKAEKITLLPLNLDEDDPMGGATVDIDQMAGADADTNPGNLDEAQTDYQKRRQRERDVDAGRPVTKPRQPKMTDYQKRRAQDRKDMELGEDQNTSGVESAIIRRIMVSHLDWLQKFGPEKVMQAAEEVAYNVGDVDEIGTSDVSAYVREVGQILGAID